MLYIFYGEDQEKARGKWRQTLAVFATKNSAGDVFHFDPYKFDQRQLEELAGSGAGLFNEKRLVAGDRLLENEEALSWFEEWLPAIVASTNTFVLLENKLDAKLAKKIEVAGGKLGQSELGHLVSGGTQRQASKFNPFALANALGNRDRQRAWVELQTALQAGEAAEEIFWRLTWQAKTMLLVKKSAGQKLTSLKPFVLQKTSRQVARWSEGELEHWSAALIALWHESRRGRTDFELGLERLVLSL